MIQRFLIPSFIASLYYFFKYRCIISPKAEVELSPNLKMGKGVVISSFCKFKATDGPLIIGKEAGFAISCFVASSAAGIMIGEYSIFGPNTNISAVNYGYDRLDIPFKEQEGVSKGIRIGKNVWIGSGVTILDGAEIGDNTIVVANSLVNRRFPSNCIVQGNPAKVIYKRPTGQKTEPAQE